MMGSNNFELVKASIKALQFEIQVYLDGLATGRFLLIVEFCQRGGERVSYHLLENLGDLHSSRLYGVVDVSTEAGRLQLESSMRRIQIFAERLVAEVHPSQ